MSDSVLRVVVCTLGGAPIEEAEASVFSATASLDGPGTANMTLRSQRTTLDRISAWKTMIAVCDRGDQVLWCGVVTGRRGDAGSGSVEVRGFEWTHWLSKVAPLSFDSTTPPYDGYGDYDTKKVGFIVEDLMVRIDQTGFHPSPLLTPPAYAGAVVSLGEPSEGIDRQDVWSILAPIRNQGIEIGVVTSMVNGVYVPQVIVGDPTIGNSTPFQITLGSDASGGGFQEDGGAFATRWRVRGGSEAVERTRPNTATLLVDGIKNYEDKFIDANDEEAELALRAERMLSATASAPMFYDKVTMGPGERVRPGDAVMVNTRVSTDPSSPPELHSLTRVQSVEFTHEKTVLSLARPDPDVSANSPSPRASAQALKITPINTKSGLVDSLQDMSKELDLVAMRRGSVATGDVAGPAASTDNAMAKFDGTTGKKIQNSKLTEDDLGHLVANGNLGMTWHTITDVWEAQTERIVSVPGGQGFINVASPLRVPVPLVDNDAATKKYVIDVALFAATAVKGSRYVGKVQTLQDARNGMASGTSRGGDYWWVINNAKYVYKTSDSDTSGQWMGDRTASAALNATATIPASGGSGYGTLVFWESPDFPPHAGSNWIPSVTKGQAGAGLYLLFQVARTKVKVRASGLVGIQVGLYLADSMAVPATTINLNMTLTQPG